MLRGKSSPCILPVLVGLSIHSLKEVQKEYEKNFDFLKQHASQHVAKDIKEKGTVDNFSTRNGEGVQQEASQAFEQTNMKDAEHQVSVQISSQLFFKVVVIAIDGSN